MHNYICPACGARLDPGERCDCIGFRMFARLEEDSSRSLRMTRGDEAEKKNAPVAATTEAVNAKASNNKISITHPKEKSNTLYGNEGYRSCIDETADQKALIEWCALMKGKYPALDTIYHIPNEGKRSRAFGALLKSLGLKKGVPDLCLPVARGKWHSLYIEMKSAGGKPTVEQNQWLCKLRAQGHRCIVAWSFEYARDFIEWYLNYKEEEQDND